MTNLLPRWVFWVGVVVLCLPAFASAQRSFDVAVPKRELTIEPAEAQAGQVVTLRLHLEMADGWHTYPTVQPDPGASSQVNRIEEPQSTGGPVLIPLGPWKDPMGSESRDASEIMIKELHFYHGSVTWEMKAVVSPKATARVTKITVPTRLLACDKDSCLPPRKVVLETPFAVLAGTAPVNPEFQDSINKVLNPVATPTPPEVIRGAVPPPSVPAKEAKGIRPRESRVTVEQHTADLEAVLEQMPSVSERGGTPKNIGLGAFLGTAIFWGFISLVTPCVFPMIPITISSFLKRSDQSVAGAVKQALIYCATIIIVLGISAFALLSVFRALSVNPYMNVAIGLLFVFFAFSLLGMYDITLPSGLANFTGSREKQGGAIGTIFMALTFTIISFTCVAPFLGGFGGMAASGQFTTFELILGGFAFATAFAAPFFLLALFPTLLKRLPKAGNWMNSVKVVMGFLELAAALKFFRTAELRLVPEVSYFTYDGVLALWIGISVFIALYLLCMYHLPHDYPQDHISVTRMFIGLMFVGFAVYITPALFRDANGERQRPTGTVYAWVDAFLLPEVERGELPWSSDLKGTLDEARKERERTGKAEYVFVDFTGVTCTNCKYNEKNVFSTADVKPLFQPYRLVQMYTDDVPEGFYGNYPVTDKQRTAEGEANVEFQRKAFGDEKLPLYAILEPVTIDGQPRVNVIGVYDEGKINDPKSFMDFLRKPFTK